MPARRSLGAGGGNFDSRNSRNASFLLELKLRFKYVKYYPSSLEEGFMAKKVLTEQIAERKKEMEEKNINGKTAHIATVLGHRTEGRKDGCETVVHRFENKNFWIEDYSTECSGSDGTMGGFYREVKYNGKRVFYMAGGGEESFIPGEWEKEFNRLYSRAQKRYKELEEAKAKLAEWRKEEQERKERKRWGL